MCATDPELLCPSCLGNGEVVIPSPRDPAHDEPTECHTCRGDGCVCHRGLPDGAHWTLCPINPAGDRP